MRDSLQTRPLPAHITSTVDGIQTPLAYVLITAVRDEVQFIEHTIKSVVAQTVRPMRWVVVSDGSTDGTDHIVSKYAAEYPWIEFLRMPGRRERHFAGKVDAFNAGFARVKNLRFDVIGNLDADVTFECDYFGFLLNKFAENPELGVAGTPFIERSTQYDYRFTSIEHVSGPCQLFRRECFEAIGGYVPRKIGGVDLVAVLSARMKGWQTRTFLGKSYVHQRLTGTATQSALIVPLKGGWHDYVLGSHPAWEFSRCIYQMVRRPILLGGILRLVGFVSALACRVEKQVPAEFVNFRRKEQMRRLRDFLAGLYCLSWPVGNLHFVRSALHLPRLVHFAACHGLALWLSVSAFLVQIGHHQHVATGNLQVGIRQSTACESIGMKALVAHLTTPAGNEARFVDLAIGLVVASPSSLEMVVVSNSSSDRTDDIVTGGRRTATRLSSIRAIVAIEDSQRAAEMSRELKSSGEPRGLPA